jgi:hypothetical protein
MENEHTPYIRLQDAIRVANHAPNKESQAVFYRGKGDKPFIRVTGSQAIKTLKNKGYALIAKYDPQAGRVVKLEHLETPEDKTVAEQLAEQLADLAERANAAQQEIDNLTQQPPAEQEIGATPSQDSPFKTAFRDPLGGYSWLKSLIAPDLLVTLNNTDVRQAITTAARQIFKAQQEQGNRDFSAITFDDFIKGSDYESAVDAALRYREDAQAQQILNQVTTAKEAAEDYDITEDGVRKAVKAGLFPARRAGNSILMLKSSVAARWKPR